MGNRKIENQNSGKRVNVALILGVIFLIIASIGLILYLKNPIDDPATGNQASGNLSVAIVFGIATIICFFKLLRKNVWKSKARANNSIQQPLKNEPHNAPTINTNISADFDLVEVLRQQFEDSVDEYADDGIEDLNIALDTYPNPGLPLHKEMENSMLVCKKHNDEAKKITSDMESAVIRICNNRQFTEEQYEALEELDEYLTETKNMLATTCGSFDTLANSIHSLRIPDFKLAKPQAKLVVALKELNYTYKNIIGVYANLSKRCKMVLKTATIIEDDEDDIDFDDDDDIFDDSTLTGHQFEYYCADLLKKNGFQNIVVTKGSGDQGVDVTAMKDGIHYAFQCKHYSSPLGNTPVQEVYAGKAIYNCHVGVVMTNSTFTKGAIEAAEKTGVLLWNGEKLRNMKN